MSLLRLVEVLFLSIAAVVSANIAFAFCCIAGAAIMSMLAVVSVATVVGFGMALNWSFKILIG